MSIGKKLYFGFIAIIILMVISAVISFNEMTSIDEEYSFLIADRVEKVMVVNEIEKAIALQGLYLRSYYINPEQPTLENLKAQDEAIQQSFTKLDEMLVLEDMIEQLQIMKDNQAKFVVLAEEVINLVNAGQLEEAADKISLETRPVNETIRQSSGVVIERQQQLMADTQQETQAGASAAKTLLIVVTMIAIIAATILGILITRAIRNPIVRLAQAAEEIAKGDLTQQDITVKSRDEVYVLAQSFNTMKGNLRDLVQRVSENAAQTTASSEELAASTEQVTVTSVDLAKRIEMVAEGGSQAAQTGTESAIAIEETAKSVQDIAESTQQLHNRATTAQAMAVEGDTTLKQAEQQMEMIQQSSDETNARMQQLTTQSAQIENISRVITGIANQTNLLALNASIEAARAGEHGKGFAVVADEVRKLAEESKTSAEQIGQLTSAIQADTKSVAESMTYTAGNVANGVVSIQDAQQSFTEIVAAVEAMAHQIADVSASTEQVSAATQQVAASVNEMAQAAESAAEQSEEMAAATEEQTATIQEVNAVARALSEDAMRLQGEINQFKY